MNLTFGIMTTYEDIPRLWEVIHSIEALKVPHAEIIIAGSYGKFDGDLVPDFESAETPIRQVLTEGWTPVKKNLVAKVAQYDTIVMLHDYYLFDSDWYSSWVEFNQMWEFDVASNPQYLIDGTRHFTDWVVWDHPTLPRYTSLGYYDWINTQCQYISGGYFLVKRDFLQQNPFDESMQPGSAEDVEWSLRIRKHAIVTCNPLAKVRHNKQHRDAGKTGFPFIQQGV